MMNKPGFLYLIIMVSGTLLMTGCSQSPDPSEWSNKQVDSWFEKGEWLGGWNVKPDESINRREFAVSYHKHKERWDKAFTFLRDSRLDTMAAKRYELDGTELFAPVSEYMTKNEEDAQYEAHKKYIDIQYVIKGKELIGIAPVSDIREIYQDYNDTNDILFFSVNNITNHKADPSRFFIFFPHDAHRPNLKDGENSMVKKVVVKVQVD